MENMFVESVVGRISDNLDKIINSGLIRGKKIAIYGMDVYSFAIQSLLQNRNMTADCYVSYDEMLVMEGKRRVKGFSSRYLKSLEDIISIENIKDIDVSKTVLFNASKECGLLNKKLKSDGFENNINYFELYDWNDEYFTKIVAGKKKISLREMQNIEKNILKHFDQYCKENNIRYWVCGGTLLGTLRHNGFIPWDDDIDVFMPWVDYKRFIEGYNDNEKYRVACMDKEEYVGKFFSIWGKVLENTTIMREDVVVMQEIHPAWIDIFPIIGMPSEEEERKNILREVVEIERKFTEKFYRSNGNVKKRNEVYNDIIQISQRYDFDKSDYVGIIGTQYREKDIMTRGVFNETIRMPFEDIEVNVPIGFKEYLDNIYGSNWMEIPDESKRKTHNLDAYWL